MHNYSYPTSNPRSANTAVFGFVEFMNPQFLQRWHPQLASNPHLVEQLPTVSCFTTRKLFAMLGVSHVDIWVLDVEGAEESALLGTDFSQVRINAVAMECHHKDEEKNKRKMAILEANNFKCDVVIRNCMCKHNEFQAHTAPSFSVK